MILQAFIDELASIKLAQPSAVLRGVQKMMTAGDPTAKAKGLGRIGQVLTGSRQKALAEKFHGVTRQYGRFPGGGVATELSQFGPTGQRRLGGLAKSELAERTLRKRVGKAAVGTGVGLTGLGAGAAVGGR